MRRAMRSAGLAPQDISYINAHGTSTSLNDVSETRAIKAAGDRAHQVPISSTKSVTGHLMGAAGSVEAVFSVKAITEQFIPPTINLHVPDPECDLDYTPNVGRTAPIQHVMSNLVRVRRAQRSPDLQQIRGGVSAAGLRPACALPTGQRMIDTIPRSRRLFRGRAALPGDRARCATRT